MMRTRNKIVAVLALVLSLVGCNNDVERPASKQNVEIDTGRGRITLRDVHRDVKEGSFSASVSGRGTTAATLRLTSTGDGMTTRGAVGELVDANGRVLYSIETAENDATGEYMLRLGAGDDFMTINRRDDAGRVVERYEVGAHEFVLEYPSLPEQDRLKAINYYQHGLPADRLPDDVANLVAQLGQLDAFYKSHVSGTLESNPDGELLVQIMSAPQFPHAVKGDTGPQTAVGVDCPPYIRTCFAICYLSPNSLACWACSVIVWCWIICGLTAC